MTQYEKLNFVNGSPPALNAATLNHMEDGIAAATEGVTAVEKTVKDNKTETNTALATKADKATTLAGYGITDGENVSNKVSAVDFQNLSATDYPSINALYNYHTNYVESCYDEIGNLEESKADKSSVDTALSGKLDNTAGSVKRENIEAGAVGTYEIDSGAVNTINIAYGAVTANKIAIKSVTSDKIANGAVTADKLADEVKTSINSKYDSSNVETGSGTLTPYTTSADIVKNADFTYQRVGRVVTVNVNIVFNAGANDGVRFTNLPYVCKNTVNPRGLCVSTAKTNRIWAINRNDTMLNIISEGSSASYTDGETLAFMLSYLVS